MFLQIWQLVKGRLPMPRCSQRETWPNSGRKGEAQKATHAGLRGNTWTQTGRLRSVYQEIEENSTVMAFKLKWPAAIALLVAASRR